jgi:hypothetical protein
VREKYFAEVGDEALTLSDEKKDPMLKRYLTTEMLPAAAAKWSAVRPSWRNRDGVHYIIMSLRKRWTVVISIIGYVHL